MRRTASACPVPASRGAAEGGAAPSGKQDTGESAPRRVEEGGSSGRFSVRLETSAAQKSQSARDPPVRNPASSARPQNARRVTGGGRVTGMSAVKVVDQDSDAGRLCVWTCGRRRFMKCIV